jgi:hypothetical protein
VGKINLLQVSVFATSSQYGKNGFKKKLASSEASLKTGI